MLIQNTGVYESMYPSKFFWLKIIEKIWFERS